MNPKTNEVFVDLLKASVQRSQYIALNGLDPKIWNAAENWAPDAANDYLKNFQTVVSEFPEVLGKLRHLTQPYSGYNIKKAQDIDENSPWVKLWQERAGNLPDHLRFPLPNLMGELGHLTEDGVLNHDAFVYQERIYLLNSAGCLHQLKPSRILEIGGGFGALALALTGIFPDTQYYICDLVESLMFSGLYLSENSLDVAVYPRLSQVTLVPNYRFQEFVESIRCADLVINTLSMSEMSADQVAAYCHGIVHMIAKGGCFFEQNMDNRHLKMINAADIITKHFPIRQDVHDDGKWKLGSAHVWRIK